MTDPAAGSPPVGAVSPPTGDPSVVVRAAGGVVWRRVAGSGIEVVLVHRPRYDDWSLPKGKVDPGESDEGAAQREVREESSVVARLGPELPGTTYVDRSGRTKTVRYWAMTDTGAGPSGDNEVDEAVWVPIDEARHKLSYERDIPVLDALAPALGAAGRLRVQTLDHIVIVSDDIEGSLSFWCGTLGLEGVRVDEWRLGSVPFPSVRVDAGTIIDLLPRRGDAPRRDLASALDHICLVIDPTDLAAVATSGVLDVVDGPGERFGARGMGTSLYVQGPDGLVIELRHYP